jgi:hypothetical protein
MLSIKATLRVFSKVHTLPAIGELLGEPTKGFSKGDEWAPGKRMRETTLWALESTAGRSESLETHLWQLISFLDEKPQALSELKDCKKDLFCMLGSDNGQGGATLSCALLRQIAKHGLDIVFDVYATED